MSDTLQTVREPFTEKDLRARSEPLEVTPDLVAANLSFGGDQLELPDEMMSAVRRIYQDQDFNWPTTVAVTRIGSAAVDRADATAAWSRISVLGTGYDPKRPVSLSLTNASGFSGGSVHLVDAAPNESGFLGVDVIVKAVERRSAEWSGDPSLTLLAQQTDGGRFTHRAELGGLPPHALWQWVR